MTTPSWSCRERPGWSRLATAGYPVPNLLRHRDLSAAARTVARAARGTLARVYHDDGAAARAYQGLTDHDECFQAWRHRHLSMMERGVSGETGGAGADLPGARGFAPVFPDLWAVRSPR